MAMKVSKFAFLSLFISMIFIFIGYLVQFEMAPESLLQVNTKLVAKNVMLDEEPAASFYFFGGIVFLIVTVMILDKKG